jgi:Astacin (Peptidase family M12A)
MAESGSTPSRRRKSSSRSGGGADEVSGELIASEDVRTGLITGATFFAKPVQYVVKDGLALFEGDIVLGTEDEMQQRTDEHAAVVRGELESGVLRTGAQFRWPSCRIPFTIEPALPNQARITDAIAHWEANTRFRFVARTAEADFVTFRPGGGCSSSVGRQGGQQFVNLAAGCSTGNVIHEIGHVVGLWHEQSREDRDAFVTINWPKIQPAAISNFNQHITDGDDVGAYDYGSIMHYPRDAFSIDGSDTITPINPPTAVIGQRTALSPGDIAAANSVCPIVKLPKEPIKDGRFDTRKELIKDLRLDTRKELVLDTQKELIKDRIKEVAKDRIKEAAFDPPFGKREDPVITPGRVVQPVLPVQPGGPGGGIPFAVAMPHDAPSLADQGPEGLQATAEELDRALQEIAEMIAQLDAQRAGLQAQYDEMHALLQQALDAHDQSAGT